MPQSYTLIFETSVGAPTLGCDFLFQSPNSEALMASANFDPEDKEPMSHRDLEIKQRKDRGERKPSDIMIETFRHPGDESWAERASASLIRKSSSKSKESTPFRDAKECSPAGGSSCSKESTPSDCSKRSLSFDDKINFISGNPEVEVTKGIIHLFKQNVNNVDTEMMCMLGVPAKHKTPDLLQLTAACHQDLEYIRIVHDSSPNQYMILLKFTSKEAAKEFHAVYNGLPYNNMEPEVCSVIPVSGLEQCNESDYSSPSSGTELPYCTICLERMDESVSTVMTILCNHKFHSSCLAQWEDPTCPVCRYVQTPEIAHDQVCMDCQSTDDLWICLVCGYVGCGRYAGGHAHAHFLDTEHCYSMQLGHNRVWDYVGDNFVHRLVQNTEDGKLVEQEARRDGAKHEGGFEVNEDKVDSLQLEYTYLLTSQLEDQRRYYEKKLGRIEEAAGHELSELTHRAKNTEEEKHSLSEELENVKREKIKMEAKFNQLNQKLSKLSTELTEEKQLNKSLRENQDDWQLKLKRTEIELNVTKEVKDKEISDLKEQVRDLMFFLEAKDKVQESEYKDEIEEGNIIVAENGGFNPLESAPPATRKTSKSGKRSRKN